jgi:hypothetical protein
VKYNWQLVQYKNKNLLLSPHKENASNNSSKWLPVQLALPVPLTGKISSTMKP